MEGFDEILFRMKEKYKALTGIEVAEDSDIGVRLSVLAGELFSTKMNLEWLKAQSVFTTATGEFLDSHGALRGLTRYKASKAQGNVIFSLAKAQERDIFIPCGVVVSATVYDEVLCFETVEDVTIFKGTTSAHARVQALEEGRKYNVKEGAVRGFVSAPSLVSLVTNPDAFEGGSDRESDEKFRERIKESLRIPPCAANCAYYKNTALTVSGVSGAGVVPKGRGAGTVDVYVAAQGAEVSDETLKEVQELLNKEREVNVDVKVFKASPIQISYYLQIDVKEGYDFNLVSRKCREALSDFIAECGVGGKLTLTKAGEKIMHIEGVEDYSFANFTNKNITLEPSEFAVTGNITVAEGV
ncbi:MAG: baseplate J/gp47 family protein [Ruminococcus sp.]|nr:baseplate J/gp47 family protein [Ruminococcus sp.]